MWGRTPLTNDGYLSILLHVLIDFIRKTYNHGMQNLRAFIEAYQGAYQENLLPSVLKDGFSYSTVANSI